ncbi:YchF/TatD family DNA exonuclease [Granulicella sp. 5B5]|nr:TatD family hydrolase [Granulicella sp. 5B5]QMV20186.1 YchF/TatD family DNA exonuclease [Granulicella sp. 5B5]
MLIDSHCHLDDYEDLPKVLSNAASAGVTTLLAIGIGDGPDTMHRALEIAHQSPSSGTQGGVQVWATAGIHPQEAHRADAAALSKLETLAQDPRCIAIGEIGLDYYHLDNPDISTQQAAFIAQLQIAAAARKPITIHCRTSELAIPAAKAKYEPADAWDDLLALLRAHWQPHGIPGIMHCFSGNEQQAQHSLDLGFYLSFAGNVTYPKSVTIQQVARTAPADRILVETDAPFLAPVPLRGQRNEPANTALTAQFVAGLRGLTPSALAAQTTENFHRLFPETAA